MTSNGLTFSSRLVSIVLAVGVHAAAAAAFMLTPKTELPAPPEGVEIEMLAEVTAEVADEATPTVAAEATQVMQAQEAEPGDAQDVTGKEVGEVAALDNEKTEVAPDEAKPVEQETNTSEAETPSETKPTETPDVAALADPTETPEMSTAEPMEVPPVSAPVEMERPVIEAPKPAAKKTAKRKKEQRRASVAGTTVSKQAKRTGASSAVVSGGTQSSSAYASIVQSRLAGKRSRLQSMLGSGMRGRVVLTFSIGAGGGVNSVSVTSSSGNSRFDSIAKSIVASTSFPPPPNGRFSGRIPFNIASQ
jgi:protein TonB